MPMSWRICVSHKMAMADVLKKVDAKAHGEKPFSPSNASTPLPGFSGRHPPDDDVISRFRYPARNKLVVRPADPIDPQNTEQEPRCLNGCPTMFQQGRSYTPHLV